MTAARTDRIRARLEQKREEYQDYRRHLDMRVREEDLHGIWDCGACMSEVSSYIDALEFCLDAITEGQAP